MKFLVAGLVGVGAFAGTIDRGNGVMVSYATQDGAVVVGGAGDECDHRVGSAIRGGSFHVIAGGPGGGGPAEVDMSESDVAIRLEGAETGVLLISTTKAGELPGALVELPV